MHDDPSAVAAKSIESIDRSTPPELESGRPNSSSQHMSQTSIDFPMHQTQAASVSRQAKAHRSFIHHTYRKQRSFDDESKGAAAAAASSSSSSRGRRHGAGQTTLHPGPGPGPAVAAGLGRSVRLFPGACVSVYMRPSIDAIEPRHVCMCVQRWWETTKALYSVHFADNTLPPFTPHAVPWWPRRWRHGRLLWRGGARRGLLSSWGRRGPGAR